MTRTEAERIVRTFYGKNSPSREDAFLFTEALEYLIEETKDPHYMLELGGYYYGIRDFEHALKYYELAAEYKLVGAWVCLGYIWYYGRTGTRDYEKAFHYYSLAADAGNLTSAYKLADMYKNGYAVERNYEKYKEIIERLYPQMDDVMYYSDPLPEVYTRLASIRAEEGKTQEAIALYEQARSFLAQRIRHSDFFGNLSIMRGLIDELYRLRPFDRKQFDLFDLYYLLSSPCRVTFWRARKTYTVNVTQEEEGIAIEFEGKWFRTRDDFFAKAVLDGKRLTALGGELYGFEVE